MGTCLGVAYIRPSGRSLKPTIQSTPSSVVYLTDQKYLVALPRSSKPELHDEGLNPWVSSGLVRVCDGV